MRLVDVDEVIKYFPTEEPLCRWALKNATTVEAIPIEWIDRWSKQFWKEINGKRYYMGDGYDTVWDMLEAWEKENGKEKTIIKKPIQ